MPLASHEVLHRNQRDANFMLVFRWFDYNEMVITQMVIKGYASGMGEKIVKSERVQTYVYKATYERLDGWIEIGVGTRPELIHRAIAFLDACPEPIRRMVMSGGISAEDAFSMLEEQQGAAAKPKPPDPAQYVRDSLEDPRQPDQPHGHSGATGAG